MTTIRVILSGVGGGGTNMVRIRQERPEIEVVAGWCYGKRCSGPMPDVLQQPDEPTVAGSGTE